VRYFVDFFDSLGLSANNAEGLASAGHPQPEKVAYYLSRARIILVLATFDEEITDTKSARPNVYLELQESISRRKNDTLVLRETRADSVVDLGSNLYGETIEYPFSRDAIHRVVPAVLRELRQRDLVRPMNSSDGAYEAGKILNDFLDEMDIIWDREFDQAWSEIFHTSYDHETDFATTLDLFFQEYQAVFSALIRDKKRGEELKAVADATLLHAWALAARAWEIVADAKRGQASTARARLRNRDDPPSFKDAVRLVADAKKEREPIQQIVMFRKAIEALNLFINPKGRR
jgi:hypothetical protein